jgi:hypothetical protein
LIVGAGRWLIGSFFAPFQKIDARQRHGHRIRVFSASRPRQWERERRTLRDKRVPSGR